MVKQSKSLGLVGAIREEVQDDVVARDVHQLPRRAAPVEARHYVVGVAVQDLHHVRLVGDLKEGEVEEDGVGSGHVDGPVANAAGPVLVGEVGGVDHSGRRGVVSTASPDSSWKEEHKEKSGCQRRFENSEAVKPDVHWVYLVSCVPWSHGMGMHQSDKSDWLHPKAITPSKC